MLSCVEHEKSIITSGPEINLDCRAECSGSVGRVLIWESKRIFFQHARTLAIPANCSSFIFDFCQKG